MRPYRCRACTGCNGATNDCCMTVDDEGYRAMEKAAIRVRATEGPLRSTEEQRRADAALEQMALRRQLKALASSRALSMGGRAVLKDHIDQQSSGAPADSRGESGMEEKMSKTCSVEGCEKGARYDGMCIAHYVEKYGTSPKKKCSVEGCEKVVFKEGRCYRHLYNPDASVLPEKTRNAGDRLNARSRKETPGASEGLLRTKVSHDEVLLGKLAKTAPKAEPAPEEHTVVLNFSSWPDIREKLNTSAAAEFRTPEMHAMYLLHLALDVRRNA